MPPRSRATLTTGLDLDPADPPVAGSVRRDRAMDALRGVAICAMIASHVSGRGLFTTLIHLPTFASAADWFVLLSGATVGMRAEKRFARGAGLETHRALWRRAGLIYLVHCALTLAVLAVHRVTGRLDAPGIADLGGVGRTMWMVGTLQVQPHDLMNILPLYVMFLLVSPLLLEGLRHGRTGLVLLSSAALWACAQRWPSLIPLPSPSLGPVSFSVAGWQLAFVIGMVLGYRRHAVTAGLARRPLSWALLGLAAAMFLMAQLQRRSLSGLHLTFSGETARQLLNKETWGAVRAAYVTLLLGVAYAGLAWWNRGAAHHTATLARFIDRTLAALQLIGRKSLRCFILHLPVALSAIALGAVAWPRWAQDLLAVSVMLIVYGAAHF